MIKEFGEYAIHWIKLTLIKNRFSNFFSFNKIGRERMGGWYGQWLPLKKPDFFPIKLNFVQFIWLKMVKQKSIQWNR